MTPNTGSVKNVRFFAASPTSYGGTRRMDTASAELGEDYIIHRSGAAIITNTY